ncbi:hypothetical protein D3C76_479100 [compost metagenome]
MRRGPRSWYRVTYKIMTVEQVGFLARETQTTVENATSYFSSRIIKPSIKLEKEILSVLHGQHPGAHAIHIVAIVTTN